MSFDPCDEMGRGAGPDWSQIGFSRRDRHTLFREIVIGEMERGPITRHEWRRLVQYAAMLDLTALEAGELIGQAREAAGTRGVRAYLQPLAHRADATKPEAWSTWSKVAVGCAIAAVLDASFFHFIF
jgi:hypothetical protein